MQSNPKSVESSPNNGLGKPKFQDPQGHIKTRAARSDQIYIHSRCAASGVRTRGFLPKFREKKKVSATAASTCKVFVRRFGWNFETYFLLSLVALENLFLLL